MKIQKYRWALAAVLAIATASTASAAVLYHQDFEDPLDSNQFNDAATSRVKVSNVWADNSDDWNRHHVSTNQYLNKGGLSGYVMGHVDNLEYGNREESIYTIQLDLANVSGDGLRLMFDYDSWIANDDGFSVAAYTGSLNTTTVGDPSYTLLDPTGASDMQYDANLGYTRLDNVQNGELIGFNGSVSAMTGVAMFDLSGFAGMSDVNLRFAFGANRNIFAEGINIDNIKVRGRCVGGYEPGDPGDGCNPPEGGSVPEPATLALSLLGLAAVYRRNKKVV